MGPALLETWRGLSFPTQALLVGCAWWLTACAVAVPLGRWIHRGQQRGES